MTAATFADVDTHEPAAGRGFVGVPYVCAYLDLARSTVYVLMNSGQLRSTRIGRRRLIHIDDLNAYAEGLRG